MEGWKRVLGVDQMPRWMRTKKFLVIVSILCITPNIMLYRWIKEMNRNMRRYQAYEGN